MIDLGKLQQDLYKIKLADGTILKLKKPTQAMLLTIMSMADSDKEEIEIIEELNALMLRIFNRNTNGLEFSKDDIEEMLDIENAMMVLQDYAKFSFKQLGE